MSPHLAALFAKADAFTERVTNRHASDLRCAPGCDSCCLGGLTATALEADAVAEALASLPPARVAALAAVPASDARCSLLDASGRCSVYAARPLVCRTHGIPVRTRDAKGLPVVSSCALNFTARGPAAADPDCILDQATLSTLLAATHAALGLPTGRTSLRQLLDDAAHGTENGT